VNSEASKVNWQGREWPRATDSREQGTASIAIAKIRCPELEAKTQNPKVEGTLFWQMPKRRCLVQLMKDLV